MTDMENTTTFTGSTADHINSSMATTFSKPPVVVDLDMPFDPDPVSKATVDMVTDILTCHVIPVMSLFGIIGNVLNLVVFAFQKRAPLTNTILAVLAVVDACYILFENLDYVTCVIRRNDVIAARNFDIMKIPQVLWIGVTLGRISATLTVVIAVERCLMVKMPLKMKALVTSRAVYVTSALACVIPALLHIPAFLFNEIEWRWSDYFNTTLPYLKLTTLALDHPQFVTLYKDLVVNILLKYGPVAVVIVCTWITIVQLRRYARWRMETSNAGQEQEGGSGKFSDRDTRVSIILVRICVVFIVCSIPGCVLLTIRLIQPEFDYYGVYSKSFGLTVQINEFFLVVNSSANFIIYMKSGEDFRRTLYRILRAAPCFRFLYRCVMRTDKLPEVSEGYFSTTADTNKARKRNNLAFSETGFSTTDVSGVYSTTTVSRIEGEMSDVM